jgi:Uma2 family endonuclease
MTPITQNTPATLVDLMRTKGKAELIGGRIVEYMPTGLLPSRVARRITRSLEDYVPTIGRGEAFTDNLGYAIDPPLPSGRQSFSPDASFYDGPLPANLMGFIEGPPTFAAEVRSDRDYGPAADRAYADKRKDYFFAGALAVWDVDPIGQTVTVYRAADPTLPTIFRAGDTADAEPAVPGWRLKVDDIFAV